jgi:hypothetical protein
MLLVNNYIHDIMGRYHVKVTLVELSLAGMRFDPCTPTLRMDHPNSSLTQSGPIIINWLYNVFHGVSP